MGCICPKSRTGDAGDDYVEFGKYIGQRNFCGQKSGRGQYYYDNGDMYDGMWKRNKKHGYGVYTYRDGSRLEGFFENDEFFGNQLPEDQAANDDDQDEPLPRNAGSRHGDQTPILSEDLLDKKKEKREQRKQEHQDRIEEMKKKYGIPKT